MKAGDPGNTFLRTHALEQTIRFVRDFDFCDLVPKLVVATQILCPKKCRLLALGILENHTSGDATSSGQEKQIRRGHRPTKWTGEFAAQHQARIGLQNLEPLRCGALLMGLWRKARGRERHQLTVTGPTPTEANIVGTCQLGVPTCAFAYCGKVPADWCNR